ncbi:cysteine protease StiP family protein [Moraxella boevrei]|uniref:cysteine protease StiP family protein n=1 Tax=Faucicola boevrei TaxID=346665 RepID=UPI003735B45D
MKIQPIFSGSYLPTDVNFLLKKLSKQQVSNTDVVKKEQLIQSGERHYSQMLTVENPPTDRHQQLFLQALAMGKTRMASDVYQLANTLYQRFSQHNLTAKKPLLLVSLVRAGVPLGVLLQRIFTDKSMGCDLASVHFGVSIIRERGLDKQALTPILEAYPDSPLLFVDGWTGKGAIYGELQQSLAEFNNSSHPFFANIFHQNLSQNTQISENSALTIPLVTLADPAGVAWLSSSDDDWLMPASLLNSTVSGLISRTLLNENPTDFHGCLYYDNLEKFDNSLFFLDEILQEIQQNLSNFSQLALLTPKSQPSFATQALILQLADEFGIVNFNRIKPTIAEATRAVLRREPERVLVQRLDSEDIVLLRHLCEQKAVAIDVVGDKIAPYQAITLIKKRQ